MGSVVVLASSAVWSQVQVQAPTTAPATTQKATDVVAQVGDQKLTRGELDLIKKYLAPKMPAEQEPRLIEFWKFNAALSNQARKNGFDQNPELEPAKKMMTNQFLGQLYMRSKATNVEVTDQEVKDYYEANKSQPSFQDGAYVTAKFIATAKREEIDAIKKQLTDNAADFDKVFEANKETTKKVTGMSDPAISNVLSTTLVDSLGQPVAGALTMVAVDQVIGPRMLPNNKGFILFKISERKPGQVIPLEKKAEEIRSMLMNQKQMKTSQEIQEQAEKEAGIVRQNQPMMGGPRGPQGKAPRIHPNVRPSTQPAVK
jgi:peptidyl-prolyl cis-trans isomerase C